MNSLWDRGAENWPTAPMKIVKSEHNNQLRQGEGTHLRKYEFPTKHGTKAKKRPWVPCAPSMGRSCGQCHARKTPWVFRRGHICYICYLLNSFLVLYADYAIGCILFRGGAGQWGSQSFASPPRRLNFLDFTGGLCRFLAYYWEAEQQIC